MNSVQTRLFICVDAFSQLGTTYSCSTGGLKAIRTTLGNDEDRCLAIDATHVNGSMAAAHCWLGGIYLRGVLPLASGHPRRETANDLTCL